MLSLFMLGPLQASLDGEPVTDFKSDKVRALLAYLAVELAGPPSGFSVTFCPKGSRFVTGSGEGTITLWEAESGLPLLSLGGQTDPIGGVACSPDGEYLATAGFDGTTRVFVVQPDRLLTLARSRLTRSFTLEECQKYLHLEQCPAQSRPLLAGYPGRETR